LIALLLMLALECPVFIGTPEYVYAKVYYLHENPRGLRWVYTTPVSIESYRYIIPNIQGHPVAFEWWTRTSTAVPFTLKKLCGEVPDPVYPLIFKDGFESGDLEAWSE